jgi:hypothetical protein
MQQPFRLAGRKDIMRLAVCATLLAVVLPSGSVAAQRREPAPQPPPEVRRSAVEDERNAHETRQRLEVLFQQYPPTLREVLRLDPSLLTNNDYLATYPGLQAFLAQHPEVAHNPGFFIGSVRLDDWPRSEKGMELELWAATMAGVAGFTAALIIIGVLGWLVRTLIDYRRWLRLSKIQTEVHTKLLDRFTANEDLLAYAQTNAGRRFLESAPIPVETGPRSFSAPVGRILWSVQAGVVLAIAGGGLCYVSGRAIEEVREPLFVIGALAVALGVGFVVSAIVAFFLTRQLGLLDSRREEEPRTATGVS